MTNIKFHGILGETFGQNWKLEVKSVGEIVHAINTKSKNKLNKFFHDGDKKGLRWKILINKQQFKSTEPLTLENLDAVKGSELTINRKLESVDFVPVLEGAEDIFSVVLGAILVVVGIILLPYTGPLGAALILGGIGMIASGVINLLSSPPAFSDFRTIANRGGGISYLFSGPENVVGEGGNVPVGYGRLIVGSQVISASYEVTHKDATNQVSALTS